MTDIAPNGLMLDYGQKPSRVRALLRRMLNVVLPVLCVSTIAWGLWHFVWPAVVLAWNQHKLQPQRLALYEKNLRHSYAPGTLVFDETTDCGSVSVFGDPRFGPPRPARLVPTTQQAQPGTYRYWPSPRNMAQMVDWDQLLNVNGGFYSASSHSVKCAYCMRQPKYYSQYQGSDELFRHALRSSDGVERLVLIGFDPEAFLAGSPTPFRVDIVMMEGTFHPLRRTYPNEATQFRFDCPLSQPLKLYAGLEDPADESHFTIDYSTPAGEGVIDGWLEPNETVKFKIRNGPATER